MLQHILVAVDGSEPSRKAARFAHDLAQKMDGRLTLLFVIEPPRVIPIGPLDAYGVMAEPFDARHMEAARALLEDVSKDLPAARVDRRVEVGPAAVVICEQAERLKVDHVVVGARGSTRVGRWLLGSVSDRVVHHAPCSVTVVH